MAQKPHPHKETFNNKVQIYRLNIINKFKPIINSGSLVRKHLVTKFKVIDSILLTNSNPQSIVVLLCLYKEWHYFPGYKLFVSLLSGIHQICIPAFPFDPPTQSGTCNSCNMGTKDLPDMYARSPRAASLVPMLQPLHVELYNSSYSAE